MLKWLFHLQPLSTFNICQSLARNHTSHLSYHFYLDPFPNVFPFRKIFTKNYLVVFRFSRLFLCPFSTFKPAAKLKFYKTLCKNYLLTFLYTAFNVIFLILYFFFPKYPLRAGSHNQDVQDFLNVLYQERKFKFSIFRKHVLMLIALCVTFNKMSLASFILKRKLCNRKSLFCLEGSALVSS